MIKLAMATETTNKVIMSGHPDKILDKSSNREKLRR
jgi:hypothetical protein